MDIKVLGPGCAKCKKAEKIVRQVVSDLNLDVRVEKVTDMLKMSEYGVIGTPAVVIDGEVKSVGKIPKKKDLRVWLEK